jgi:ABC-type phosphate/phosphonate transport system substrate-binding protein
VRPEPNETKRRNAARGLNMNRRAGICVGLWVGAVLVALFLPTRPTSAADPDHSIVRIGIVGSLFRDTSEALVQVATRPLKNLMEAQLSVKSQIVLGGEAEQLARRLQDDEVQLGVFHGVEFAWARSKYPRLKPLILAVNQNPALHAHLVVRKDCKAEGYADLKGQMVALPRSSREHCRLFLDRRCSGAGVPAGRFYSQVTAPRDASDALDEVFEGGVQAAVIDAVDLDAYQKRKPNRAVELRTLQQSEAFPSAVVAYCPGSLPDDQVQRFREGMVATKDNPQGQQILSMCRITSFEVVPPEYEQMLQDVLKAYPPPEVTH